MLKSIFLTFFLYYYTRLSLICCGWFIWEKTFKNVDLTSFFLVFLLDQLHRLQIILAGKIMWILNTYIVHIDSCCLLLTPLIIHIGIVFMFFHKKSPYNSWIHYLIVKLCDQKNKYVINTNWIRINPCSEIYHALVILFPGNKIGRKWRK